MKITIISIKTVHTPDIGSLSFFEAERDIPFPIKRFYYIHGAPENTQRGAHAHKALRQFLFCPYGAIKLLMDDGKNKETIILDNPTVGVIVDSLMWHDMVWLEENSVLCVAASDYYNESDYLRDYDGFIKYLKESIHSTAQHSTAQHSTAQHSTAQHSTAQHSTDAITLRHYKSIQSYFSEVDVNTHFSIKRIYYIYGAPVSTERGAHAHKALKQILFCPYGSVKILLDNGKEKSEVLLDSPSKSLTITPCVWRDMVWMQENSVLCVAVSDYYDEDDYIRDYGQFIQYINKP